MAKCKALMGSAVKGLTVRKMSKDDHYACNLKTRNSSKTSNCIMTAIWLSDDQNGAVRLQRVMFASGISYPN